MTTYNTQYKLLFFISWITCYLIFPAWALPISVSARAFVFSGLLIYFIASAYLMNRWLDAIAIEKPLITHDINWWTQLKNNSWLLVVCCIAAIIHIYPLFHPILILGDEAVHLQGGLIIYDYIDVSWHRTFQSLLWVVVALALSIRIFKSRLNRSSSNFIRSNSFKYISVFLFFIFLIYYFFLLKDINYVLALINFVSLRDSDNIQMIYMF